MGLATTVTNKLLEVVTFVQCTLYYFTAMTFSSQNVQVHVCVHVCVYFCVLKL